MTRDTDKKYIIGTSSGMGSIFGEKKLFLPAGGMSTAVSSFTNPGICYIQYRDKYITIIISGFSRRI